MRNDDERLRYSQEVDLMELLGGIWKERLWVLVTAALITGGAAAYAFLANPTYEAKVFVQPPTQNDVAQLNYGRGGDSGLSMLSVKDVYAVYLRNLQSESLRRDFFRSVYLKSLPAEERQGTQDDIYAKFQKILSVDQASKDQTDRFYVKVSSSDPNQAAQWAVRYVEMAGARGKNEVVIDAKADATIKANNLEQSITAARDSARKQREDQIVRLSEALRVAKSIGLEKPPLIPNTMAAEVSAGMGGALTYMRGSIALEAEIENLKNRTSDDAFVTNLRQRQEALRFYRELQVDTAVIQTYRQDGGIDSPDNPTNPKKGIIIGLGFVLGIMLGILVAVYRLFFRKNNVD